MPQSLEVLQKHQEDPHLVLLSLLSRSLLSRSLLSRSERMLRENRALRNPLSQMDSYNHDCNGEIARNPSTALSHGIQRVLSCIMHPLFHKRSLPVSRRKNRKRQTLFPLRDGRDKRPEVGAAHQCHVPGNLMPIRTIARGLRKAQRWRRKIQSLLNPKQLCRQQHHHNDHLLLAIERRRAAFRCGDGRYLLSLPPRIFSLQLQPWIDNPIEVN